jgi:PAS domain S-box-containing protein
MMLDNSSDVENNLADVTNELALATAHDAVAVADLEGRLVHVSDSFLALWREKERKAVIGRSTIDFWQDTLKAQAAVDALNSVGVWRGEMTARRRDGSHFELGISATVVPGSDGRPAYMMALFTDITRRRRAAEKLIESEERFRRIFEQGPFAMAMSDKDFHFFKVNPAFCSMFGYTVEELNQITFKEITHPDHLGSDIENIERLMRGEISIYQTEKRYITKPGTVMWGALTLSLLRDSGGAFQYFLVMIENIDERKRAEQAMRDVQRFESLAVLAGGIAHDFNNLLLGIFGHIELAKIELPAGSETTMHLDSALSVSRRATALTQQLLTFTKGGAPKKETFPVPELLSEVAQFSLSGSNISFSVEAPDSLWFCQGDEAQVSRALENIIINARQAMPAGGTIKIDARNLGVERGAIPTLEPGPYVRIEISDQGIGIREQQLRRIFDPFFTTKSAGSGLGLSIAFSIIKRHGGHIDVQSELERGSVFTIYLPASSSDSRPATQPVDIDAPAENLSILLMDDEPTVRHVTAEMLLAAGHRVTAVEDGELAIHEYRKAMKDGGRFDMVILDLTVPGGMGGGQVVQKLLDMDPTARVIAASGYSEDPIVANPEKFGFRGSLRKPYMLDSLLRLISKICPHTA